MLNLETFQAAPGSYNISQDISTRSQVLNNAPRAAIPRGKKNPSVFISNELAKEFQGADSPPVSKYSPDATLLFKSSSMPKFGGEQRKDHFLIARDRSPGPIYLYSDRNKRACSFGVGGKALGPGLNLQTDRFYDTKVVDKRVPIRMKGYISEKVYMKNMEGLNKGKLGPGPGAYENSAVVSKGGKLPKAVRLQPLINDNPGPGSYSSVVEKIGKKNRGFGGSKKNLDIRACNDYTDNYSHEFFR